MANHPGKKIHSGFPLNPRIRADQNGLPRETIRDEFLYQRVMTRSSWVRIFSRLPLSAKSTDNSAIRPKMA